MQFFNKKFGLVILFVIFSAFSIQQIFSQEEGFGVFDINFSTGMETLTNHLKATVDISGGNMTGFRIRIQNTSDKDLPIKINFGTQINTNDAENILGCDLASETFRSHLKFDTGTFNIPARSGEYRYIQLNFNACSSGDNLGCLAIQNAHTTGIGVFDIELSKVGFIDFNVIGDALNCNTVEVSALHQNRNMFPSTEKTLPNQRSIGTLGFYKTNGDFVTTGSIELGRGGTGKTNINTSLSGYYFVTFQGLSSTKALASGVFINQDFKKIDFTSGENIFGATIEDRDENGIPDNNNRYLKVGEISPYDGEINGDDIAKLLPYINKTNKDFGLNKYDIDADGGITIADIGIIIYNLHQRSIGNEYSDSGLLPRMLP